MSFTKPLSLKICPQTAVFVPHVAQGIQHAVLSHDAKLVLLVCLGVVYLIAGNGPPVRLSGLAG